MEKKIIIGSIISTFIILMIPSISAIEYTNVVDESKSNFYSQLGLNDLKDIPDKFSNNKGKEFISNFLMIFKDIIGKYNNDFSDDLEQPLFFPILGIVFYGLIAIIILSVLFSIFNSIFTIIKLILGVIIGTITGFFGSIWNVVVGAANIIIIILSFIVNVIIAIINGTLTTIANIGLFIVSILVNISNFISKIANQMWDKYVLILGLILDILKIIYDTIFNPVYNLT